MKRKASGRDGGWLMIEAMIALTVLTVGLLGFLLSFKANFQATRELGIRDQAQAALDTAVETMRTGTAFSSLYGAYHGGSLEAPGVIAPDGQPARVQVFFDVNEPALPMQYGPVEDIDGDGAKTNTNASTNYVILPTRLTLTYTLGTYSETKVQYLLLRP